MSDQPSPSSFDDSAELYAACQDGRRDAYEALWRYLLRVALKVVHDQPDAEALAQDCAQRALIRIHQRLDECREPAAFRSWSRRITGNLAIDELRRRKRLLPLESYTEPPPTAWKQTPVGPESAVSTDMRLKRLRELLNLAPISDRSRRVVIGRYLDDLPDEILAQQENDLDGGNAVQPSHIQVTRSKNMAKLRDWELLQSFWGKG